MGRYSELIKRFGEAAVPAKSKNAVTHSLEIIRRALDEFGFETVCISFNGGKDCLVMLYLVLAVFEERKIERALPALYVQTRCAFKEVDEFVDECERKHNIAVERIGQPLKEALATYMQRHPNVHSFFVGARRTDLKTELREVQPADVGWPALIRIHPLLDWEYDDIWYFLRALQLPYCVLYDEGYTSLGSKVSTTPNSCLRKNGGYEPAYKLQDPNMERSGRAPSAKLPM